MSTPNPLIPQGTFQAQAAKGASNVRLAVATIVAIHVVFFGGLLLQGCKRDTQTGQNTQPTNRMTSAESSTNLALAPIESSSLYYSSSSNLPSETGIASTPAAPTGTGFATQTPAPSPESLWQTTNLSSSITPGHTTGARATGATKEYTVARGDSFSRIASRNHTTVSALRAANPDVDPVRIKPGDKLNVPEAAPQDATGTAASPSNGSLAAGGAGGATTIYTVKVGDTLTKVAQKHGITIKQLSAANNLKTARINVGQKLKIPAPSPQASTGTTSKVMPPGL